MIDKTRAKVNGRCQDLLSVAETPSPMPSQHECTLVTGILYRVEFLHRTVQDFLIQSPLVLADLKDHAGEDFDPSATLLACYVWLIKRAGCITSSGKPAISYADMLAFEWSTEGLLHAIDAPADSQTADLIEELDLAMNQVHTTSQRAHWSNALTAAGATVLAGNHSSRTELYVAEHGQRDFVAHLIQFSLIVEVKSRLTTDPALVRTKKGRPYLDYALRCVADACSNADERQRACLVQRSHNIHMVKYLLSMGCDVNSVISTFDCRTVWDLYLRSIYHTTTRRTLVPGPGHAENLRELTWLLIQHGARDVKRCFLDSYTEASTGKYPHQVEKLREASARDILMEVFGPEEGSSMYDAVLSNGTAGSWTSPLAYLSRFWQKT